MELRLGILGSGNGSNFQAIADAITLGHLRANIVLVASDFSDAHILTRAKNLGLPVFATPPSKFKTKLEPEIESALAAEMVKAGANILILAGFMRVVKKSLLDAFPNRIINIHPSLLPAFPGLKAWEQAFQAGVSETGCTVHLVNEQIDAGKILGQTKVPILPGDTPASLHERIHAAEHRLFPEILRKIAEDIIPLP